MKVFGIRIFGIRIIRESHYRGLLNFREEVVQILKKKLPAVSSRKLKNKNITFNEGLVLINSQLTHSRIKHKSKFPIKCLYHAIISHNYFEGPSKIKLKDLKK